MKIVLTAHQFLPEYGAGTEILTYETAKELRRRGHDVEICAGHLAEASVAKEKPFETYEYDGFIVHRYNHSYKAPPPGQCAMESEHNNRLFAEYFAGYLKKRRPDIVHFFHLARLSASAIDACVECKVPMVFTPTDFWIICPTSQLRLADNSVCVGPEPDSMNCIRHIIAMDKSVLRNASKLPRWFFNLLIWCAGKRWWPDRKVSPEILAISRRRAFVKKRMNSLDRVLVPTRFMEGMLARNGLDPARARYIPYGLNLDHFKDCPPKKQSDHLRVGYIGSLLEHKGTHVLIDAIKLLDSDLPLEVKVYGKLEDDPGYVKTLKKMIGGDGRIKLLGTFPNERIGEIFSEIDVLVMPAIWYENTPLVIYSAFAARTPVIATNLGGMSEVVHHDKNGLLFEKGDSRGLSLLIKRIVDDGTLLGRLAENITPPSSIPDYVDGLEKVYAELTEKRKRR